MLYVKFHQASSAIGESIPTSKIMTDWASLIIGADAIDSTFLVADSYYLDRTGRKHLEELGIQFLCAIQSSRFKQMCDVVKSEVEKPGEWNVAWNEKKHHSLVFVWDTNQEIGKKFVLSNFFLLEDKKHPKNAIPLWDHYKICFSLCDRFNRELHDCTWPYRHGGGTRYGDFGAVHDFIFSSILENVNNAFFDIKKIDPTSMTFKELCERLSDELYVKSSSF